MKHEPSYSDIGVSQTFEEVLDVIENIVFKKLTIGKIVVKAIETSFDS
jgi:hypothetical protein